MSETDGSDDITGDGLQRVGDAARFLGLSRSTVYKLISQGVLPSVKIGGSRRVPVRAVRDLARDHPAPNPGTGRG